MSFLTVDEAADLARCGDYVIRRAIRDGELEGLFSSRWLLRPEDVERWLVEQAERRKRSGRVEGRVRRPRVVRADDRAGSVHRLSVIEQGGKP